MLGRVKIMFCTPKRGDWLWAPHNFVPNGYWGPHVKNVPVSNVDGKKGYHE
jgi:hypothetical protein